MNVRAAIDESCDYCGLPLPKPLFGRRPKPVAPDESRYCCVGCRIAASVTQDSGESGAATWAMTSLGLAVFFTMSVMTFTVAHWMYGTYDVEGPGSSALAPLFGQLLQWLTMLFSIPVLLLLGKPLVDDAVANLKAGVWTADLLLLTGVVASFLYSLTSVLKGSGSIYFETGCVILVAVTFGRWLTAAGKLRTNAVLDELDRLLPSTAIILRDGRSETVSLDSLVVGDLVSITAGDRVPVDGVIETGAAAIDEQVFTGESEPVHRTIDDRVFAGTLNLDGRLLIRATSPARGGAFGALVAAVREARNSKGRYQILADRISARFFPVVAVIASLTVIGHGLRTGWDAGLLAGLSVVLIACPCALALATPMAVWAAMGRAARRGILFRSGDALERLARVDTTRFDKTGTLTTGTPRVEQLHLSSGVSFPMFAGRVRSLTDQSLHVFSKAISRYFHQVRVERPSASVRTSGNRGLEADLDGNGGCVRVGRWEWLITTGDQAPQELQSDLEVAAKSGRPLVAVSWNGRIQGFFELAEEIRPDAAAAFNELRQMQIDLGMLTGDRESVASMIARRLNIAFAAGLTPLDKAAAVTQLKKRGAIVAMVGDGINDAPALAAADVGIALGCGTDVTRASADVCLLRNDLNSYVEAIRLARDCAACIRGNLRIAFAYNGVGIALAAAGALHPSVAAVLMVVSSLVVISRSMRLGRERSSAQEDPVRVERIGDSSSTVLLAPYLAVTPDRKSSVLSVVGATS